MKEDKLRQIKKIMINPNESIYDFNTRFLELYDHVLKDCVAFARFQNDPNYESYINSLYSQKN